MLPKILTQVLFWHLNWLFKIWQFFFFKPNLNYWSLCNLLNNFRHGVVGWNGIIHEMTSCYFTSCDFLTPILPADLLLKSERQQVSSGLQNSSKYSSQFQQCSGMYSISSSDFQFLQSFFFFSKSLESGPSAPTTNGITVNLMFHIIIIIIISKFKRFLFDESKWITI